MAQALKRKEVPEDVLKAEGQKRAELAERGQYAKIGWWASDGSKKNMESVLKKEGVLDWARENTTSVAEIMKRVISEEQWGSGRVGFKKIISEIKAEAKEAVKEKKRETVLEAVPKKREEEKERIGKKELKTVAARVELSPELKERIARIERANKLYAEANEELKKARMGMDAEKAEAAIGKATEAKSAYYDLGWFSKSLEVGKFIENARNMLPVMKYSKMEKQAEPKIADKELESTSVGVLDGAGQAPLVNAETKTKDLAAEAREYIEKLKTLSGDERAEASKKMTVQIKLKGQTPEIMTLEEYMKKTDSVSGGLKLPFISRFGGAFDENKLAEALRRDSERGADVIVRGEKDYPIMGSA